PAGKEEETFLIPDSVTDIGSNAFSGCKFLASVVIPGSVTEIGNGFRVSNIFTGCSSLKKIEVDADNSAYMSADGVLYNKEQTVLICYPAGKEGETFLFPDSVTEIGDYAFSDCTSITSFTIPSGIERIGNSAFKKCKALECVDFLGDVPSSDYIKFGYDIGWFSECDALAEINVDESSSGYSAIDGVLYNKDQTELLFCPFGYSGVLVIPSSVIVISSDIFYHCSLLTAFDVDEGNTVFSSKEGVLYNKDKSQLRAYPCNIEGAFTVPDGVTSIGNRAFENCQVEAVTLPDGVTSIGYNAFSSCIKLKSINLPDDLTSIGGGAFGGCPKLKSISLPDSVTDIDFFTFSGTGLTEVTIPNSITRIESGAFSWSALYSIVIPSSVTYMSNTVFDGCPSSLLAADGSPEFLTIYGEAGSYAETYAAENNINFEAIKLIAPNKDNDSDIEVIVDPDAVPDGTSVNVTEKDRTESSVTFDITLTVNGEITQPNGSARVKIPVPSGLNADDCKIYRKEADGTYTDMKAKAIGTFLSFITDHFSEYIVTYEKLIPDAVLGDINGDKTVNDQDSMLLSRYLAEWGNEIDTAAADINGDGRVNDQDGIVLARKLAGWYD
ncbi:MAG: leucine-rich repeat protein, partial [Ruminococcaceae bacterium]|nr:leucine-rich repeat protein [Oscillospiraceae bacterium]